MNDTLGNDYLKRQQQHLEDITEGMGIGQSCAHNNCTQCCGTGQKEDGTACVHNLYCPCKKCNKVRCGD